MSPSVLIVFRNFKLICSYFVLVAIIIFDLALHICIFIIHAEYFWLVIAGLKEKFYTLILKFVNITFCFMTEPQTMQKQPPELFCKKGVLRNFAKFTGKHLCQKLFFNKVVFSCEFCEISKNTFLYRTPPVAASNYVAAEDFDGIHLILL